MKHPGPRLTVAVGLAVLWLTMSGCGAPAASSGAATPAQESVHTVTTTLNGQQIILQAASQAIGSDGTVTIALVQALDDGWIVIHADDGKGKPGDILGEALVKTGKNENVKVTIDKSKATKSLYAMLHIDAGTQGTFEFPGPDAPLKDDYGAVIMVMFTVTP